MRGFHTFRWFLAILILPASLFWFIAGEITVQAKTIDELQTEIQTRNQEIEKLEAEIGQYQIQLEEISTEARTLETAVRALELTDKKLTTGIRVTTKKISSATLTIDRLGKEIADTRKDILVNVEALTGALRKINELESRSLVEIILAHNSFSAFWNTVEALGQFQRGVRKNLKTLVALKESRETRKSELEHEKQRSLILKERLLDQRAIAAGTRKSKDTLLRQTKNKESNYKKLLDNRIKQRNALEREILEFEARLRVEIDPTTLPKTGTGILGWPLETIKVTQHFGNTPFASKNPQVYSGIGHNGIDLRAPIGTVIKTPANGVVIDVGDTDAKNQCPGASYGKWVLVRHYNGLSTLYAHLSLIRVTPAQEVSAQDVIGYTGNTGYSTGPHLHFAVYASAAVRVSDTYKSRVCGTNLKLPLSPQNGYLNPLSYLPKLS